MVTETAAALPQMQGAGLVRDLRQAMIPAAWPIEVGEQERGQKWRAPFYG